MPTTAQMVADYPDMLLRVLAELRGAFLDGYDSRTEGVALLAAQITDPLSVQMAYQEITDIYPQAKDAIEVILKEGGEIAEAQFSRAYGSIRQMGPARLEREQPWFAPESMAEVLYYYGLLGRGFKGAGQNARTIVYLPEDIVPWLPNPHAAEDNETLSASVLSAPPKSRIMAADDSFLADMGSLLGYIHTEGLGLDGSGPGAEDAERLVERLQMPFAADDEELNVRLALMLHLANRLGWLRRGDDGRIHLTGNAVHRFLEQTRSEQRHTLWESWRRSAEWNDLCRVPGLECVEKGGAFNDPLQTRNALLRLLGKLMPGCWYSQADVVDAIRSLEPDFQRPTGNYDTWYIRDITTQEFLKGFEQWEAVEGALIRFLFRGPLHWLGALDLAEPSAGDDLQISLSQWGARWLEMDVPQPHEAPRSPMAVSEDFTVSLDLDTALKERFRVERFAQWKSSYPKYTYQINQRSLARAAAEGIDGARIAAFLQARTRRLPEKVVAALQRHGTTPVSET
ncbi:MAG: hypothetical protein KDD92_13325 [Caldilineaceae bacterium]|nr:hypothetical protein [Caldilineaceae bacterium]